MAQIQRLPSDVAAQIKASADLSSLNHVIIGLLENALDAGSGRIDIKVDFTRASCWIHDDGTGIHPSNFEETGGLCKPFHTSNQAGSKGLFLSSVAAVAVLSITSKCRQFDDANALILHFARPATRLLPAPEHMALELGDHGTKVSVHDLFGNMAVRVKQRPGTEDDRGARDREWNSLCNAVVGCVLAHGKSLHLIMKGSDAKHIFNINNVYAAQKYHDSTAGASLKLHLAKSVIQQAFHSPSSSNWIPISARTDSTIVQAIMGAEPSPQKHLQFICIGNRHMLPEGPYGILYESINQAFWNSSFGKTEDDSLDQGKARGRVHGLREKLKAWPTFVMLVQCNDTGDTYNVLQQSFIAKLTGIVTALVKKFLTEQGHQPRTQMSTRNQQAINDQGPAFSVTLPARTISTPDATSFKEVTQKSFPASDGLYSGSEFEVKFPVERSVDSTPIHKDDAVFRSQFISSRAGDIWPKGAEIKTPLILDKPHSHKQVANELNEDHETQSPCVSSCKAEHIDWIDPKTHQKFHINARTGFVVKTGELRRPATINDSILQSALLRTSQKALSRLSRSSEGIVPPKDGSWAEKFFQNWHNPVFEVSQARLPTAVPDSHTFDLPTPCGYHCTSSNDVSRELITQAPFRLSKASLHEAVIISQVDTKFILIRVPDRQTEPPNDMIILVDQHAADERIGVEKLLEDLCSSPSRDVLAYTTPLNQKSAINTIILEQPLLFQIKSQEYYMFENMAPLFAQWGILYDMTPSTGSQESHELSVISLPACIAQRCKTEPMLLLNLLRSEAWKQEEQPLTIDPDHSTDTNWVTRIRSCPSGILDLVNSRACRSAIMFNDVLTIDECKKLISDLAKCQFPFQCAHGRPSMVPLLNLGEDRGTTDVLDEKSDLVDAWRRWMDE